MEVTACTSALICPNAGLAFVLICIAGVVIVAGVAGLLSRLAERFHVARGPTDDEDNTSS